MVELVNKLKILKNPRKKSARQLFKDLNKPGYNCSIKVRDGVTIRIDKFQVPMSLNDKVYK